MINQFSYALRDLSRSYKKLFSIIITLFISLFILSLIINLETGLKKELQNNAKILLGGDFEVDTRTKQIDQNFLNELKDKSTVSSTIEFSTMLTGSLTDDDANAFLSDLKQLIINTHYTEKCFLNQKMQCKDYNLKTIPLWLIVKFLKH